MSIVKNTSFGPHGEAVGPPGLRGSHLSGAVPTNIQSDFILSLFHTGRPRDIPTMPGDTAARAVNRTSRSLIMLGEITYYTSDSPFTLKNLLQWTMLNGWLNMMENWYACPLMLENDMQ